jgi:hypothetical protein
MLSGLMPVLLPLALCGNASLWVATTSSHLNPRAGLKSHMRLVHSAARPGPSQQLPPHTPNTRHNLQPLIVPLSPSFPPLSLLGSSSSESESDPSPDVNSEDHRDFMMHDVDQPPSPSPASESHTGPSPTNSSRPPADVVRSYHPLINGFS